ncbi:protein MKS1-like [Cucurbita moschata]|uniref:Protein MKS1-like n=1 Tax=Cucurbita moschata TaxID=3662 RepID=A0A6J1EVV6_CUCMO|nr:protein MKS1-like [Cucurbita moschata]
MNPPGYPAGGSPRKKEIQLQGPRPPQLRVSQDSRKIKKPPPHPQPIPPAERPPLPPGAGATQWPQPLIIYDISPKVIHVPENNFMSVVQRLTGLSSSGASAPDGDLSPAARLAAIEKASPRPEREREREIDVSEMMDLGEISVELWQTPGILSPAPASLAPIPTGFFSPATELPNFPYSLIQELSPHWPSPSALFSAPLVSPISSPNLFNHLFDFSS